MKIEILKPLMLNGQKNIGDTVEVSDISAKILINKGYAREMKKRMRTTKTKEND